MGQILAHSMNLFWRTIAEIQGRAVLGNHGDSGRSEVTGAVNSTCKNVISIGTHQGNINVGSESNPGSPSSSQLTPKHELNHALIICHDEDRPRVKDLQDRLNQQVLDNGQRVRVVLEDDMECAAQIETAAFNSYFNKNVLLFLFITESFVKDKIQKWKSDVSLAESLTCGSDIDMKEFVVPIFTEDRTKAPYLKADRTLRSLRGIKYYDCVMTDDTKKEFLRCLNNAEERISQKI